MKNGSVFTILIFAKYSGGYLGAPGGGADVQGVDADDAGHAGRRVVLACS